MILKPPRLNPGDTIGIITPGSPMKSEALQKGIAYLESKGYQVLLAEGVYLENKYLAGPDRVRAGDINRMFASPGVKAIFASRGGYGCGRLLGLIDYQLIRGHPKILMGYSDLTTLQLALYARTGLVSFTGPMVAVEMGNELSPYTESFLWKTLTDPEPIGYLENPEGLKLSVLNPGKAEGVLFGGNLSMIVFLLGTPYEPDFSGKILLLEEVDEAPYRVDRMLYQLKHAGVFEKVVGVILGLMVNCEEPDREKPTFTVEEVIGDFFSKLSVPVLSGLAYSHKFEKVTLPLGVRARMDTELCEIVLLEGGVI